MSNILVINDNTRGKILQRKWFLRKRSNQTNKFSLNYFFQNQDRGGRIEELLLSY